MKTIQHGLVLLTVLNFCSGLSTSPRAVVQNPPKASTDDAGSKGLVFPVSLNREALEGKKFPRTWVPIASTFELDPDRPSPLEFLGQNYVAYQDNGKNWVFMDDTCPHRLAPLSEGRIDREKDVLQCSYHGWEFESSGLCVRIPQASAEVQQAALASKRSCVASYPVCVENQILFVWPWKENVLSVAGKPWACPEGMMGGINGVKSTYTRELPYGWGSLVENLIDPSHVPFAHHGMQGKRSDAIPINMTFPVDNGEQGFSFEWEDRTMGMMRAGEGEFRAPYMVRYDAGYKTETPRGRFDLAVFCLPTKPGWSRAIIMSGSSETKKEDTVGLEKKPKKKASLMSAVFKRVPVWLIHVLNNRFLDSDLAFIHVQERERQRRPTYFMPAPSDRCIAALRKWIPDYTDIDEPLPPSSPRSVLFDRYSQHTTNCKHCLAGLVSIKKWRRGTYGILAASILGFEFRVAKVSTLLCLALLRLYQKLENGFKEGGFKHYENH